MGIEKTVQIKVCPPELWRDALWLLFSRLPPLDRANQANETLQLVQQGEIDPGGFLVAKRGEEIVGVVLANVMPGNLGTLWLPQVADDQPEGLPRELISASDAYFVAKNAPLAMAATIADHGDDVAHLESGGYQRLAAILFLSCECQHFPKSEPTSTLTLRPFTKEEEPQLQRIVEQTYRETLDCPALGGVRAMSDVLAGYRATGTHRPKLWLRALRGDLDVGCLLLTDHPENDHIELVYMGVLAELRGLGCGIQLVRHAQWLTRQVGRNGLVLAVDELNAPAIRLYAEAGFQQVGRQVIFQKEFRG